MFCNKQNMKHLKCLNCGNFGHEQRKCTESVVSWGIILIKTLANNNHDKCQNTVVISNNQKCPILETKRDIAIISQYIDNMLQFLLVKRKHSLGFAEFICGRYMVDNINGIKGLFSQMINEEINIIKTETFEQVWKYFWG